MARVEIHVGDYRRREVRNALVALDSEERSTGRHRMLPYDRARGAYAADDVPPSLYRVSVDAPDYEGQSRSLLVGTEGVRETFVLGMEGMPSYHRGSVRIPFEPHDDLLAVSLRPRRQRGEREAEDVSLRAQALGLVPVPVGDAIQNDGSLVFRYPPRVNEEEHSRVMNALAADRLVRRSGTVVHLEDDSLTYLTNELIVKLREGLNEDDARGLASQFGLDLVEEVSIIKGGYLLRGRNEAGYRLMEVAARIQETGFVEFAEPNMVTTSASLGVSPQDHLYPMQWHHPLCGLPEAWEALRGPAHAGTVTPAHAFGSPGITIAIMDTGIQSVSVGGQTLAQHPDFDGNVGDGSYKIPLFYDFDTGDFNHTPPAGQALDPHGLRCAGVAAALANNNSIDPNSKEGVAGAAPNCRVLALIKPESGDDLQWAKAFCWTAGLPVTGYPAPPNPGADVVSCSFIRVSYVIQSVISQAFGAITQQSRGGKGALIVFAAGNSNEEMKARNQWAVSSMTMAVAASRLTSGGLEVRWGSSNYGNEVDLCAPVEIVTTTNPGDGNLYGNPQANRYSYLEQFGGTSAAAAYASGVAALVLSADPSLRWDEVRGILCSTAVRIDPANTNTIGKWLDTNYDGAVDFSPWYGYGRVNAEAAVLAALGRELKKIEPIRVPVQWPKWPPPPPWRPQVPWEIRTEQPPKAKPGVKKNGT